MARLKAADLTAVKQTSTGRRNGQEHQSKLVCQAAIAAADALINKLELGVYQSPAAAGNVASGKHKGEGFLNTQSLTGKSAAVGPLGLRF